MNPKQGFESMYLDRNDISDTALIKRYRTIHTHNSDVVIKFNPIMYARNGLNLDSLPFRIN